MKNKKTHKKKIVRMICMWCGQDHKKVSGIKCKKYSRAVKDLCDQGIELWKVMAIVDMAGLKALDNTENFNQAAEIFIKMWR